MTVGIVLTPDGSTPATGRQAKTGEAVVTQAHGKYYEASSRGLVFGACDQGSGVTVQTSITTTGILSLHNPKNSGVRLEIMKVSIAYFSGTMGAGAYYHALNKLGDALPTGGTTLASNMLDGGNIVASVAKGVCLAGATVVAPTTVGLFGSSLPVLASTAVWAAPISEDVDGAIVVEPGCAYQLVAVMGGAGSSPKISPAIWWEEVQIAQSQG